MDPSSSSSAVASVSLPSIHEMFPEHLLHRNAREFSRPSTKDGLQHFPSPRLRLERGPESRPYLLPGPQHHTPRTTRYDPLRSGQSDHLSVYQNHGAPDIRPARHSGVDRGSGPGYHVSAARKQSPGVPSVASLPSSSPLVSPRGLPADMAGMHIKEYPHPVQASSHYSPSIIAFPTSPPSSDLAAEDSSQLSDGENPNEPSSGKKHICPTCFKRFNRPSSLRIHVNTHTGATPFRCPWPGCGREFNVNSNMRRHYRNHNAPGYTRPNGDTRRRRRRIVDPSVDPNQQSHMVDPSHAVHDSRPGEYESDGYESDYSKSYPSNVSDYVAIRASQEKSPRLSHHRQGSASSIPSQANYGSPPVPHQYQYPPASSAQKSHTQQTGSPRHHPYPIPETRSYTPAGSSFHSSSPSPSPSPLLPDATNPEGLKMSKDPSYSASIPYLRTVTDARAVSTTLRPAFEPHAPALRSAAVRHSYAGHASGGW